MDYYKILHFNREPFSNSPDPGFFYKAPQHVGCMQNLEVSIRLRRGLNVVLGQVGTGKTTLCRRLIGSFDGDDSVESHLIFDPYFGTALDFLITVARLFKCTPERENPTEWDIKESIKHFLFRKGVDEDKTVVLIIDEGQKIPLFCLEVLREFLNYETNDAKLLQVVIFAQTEFEATLKARQNFSDRVNLLLKLGPLSFHETKEMIRFRLDRASDRGRSTIKFTYPAMRAIYRATGGYPRKIVHLCHRMILSLILQNRTKAGYALVQACTGGKRSPGVRPFRRPLAAALVLAVVLWAAFEYRVISLEKFFPGGPDAPMQRAAEKPAAPLTVEKPIYQERIQIPPASETLSDATAAKTAGNRITPSPMDRTQTPEHESARPPARPPEFLGRIGVKHKDRLSAMVARVYDEYTTDTVLKVAEANPHINDINQIAAGQVISFPVIASGAFAGTPEGFDVRIAQAQSLGDAYRLLLALPVTLEPPIRILTIWREDGTLSYHLVSSLGHTNEASARAAMEKLPPDLAAKADILDGLDPGDVILTNWPKIIK